MRITYSLPAWLEAFIAPVGPLAKIEERMAFVIAAARENVARGTGGPFAAAVFEIDSGKLVALGVNRTTTEGLSFLHAEITALAAAERRLGSYDLGAAGLPAHELVTSVEPCAMCLGAILWSGVKRVVSGACDEDARRIGFDEGPKPLSWVAELERRNVRVLTEVGRAEAAAVLDAYAAAGGPIYNANRH